MGLLRLPLGKCNTSMTIRSLSPLPKKKPAAPSLGRQTQNVGRPS